MKVIDYKEDLIDKAIDKLADDIFREAKYMIESNPYNNSVLKEILWQTLYLGKASDDFPELKRRLKEIISIHKTIDEVRKKQ